MTIERLSPDNGDRRDRSSPHYVQEDDVSEVGKSGANATEVTPLLANSVEVGQVDDLKTGRSWSTTVYLNIILFVLLLASCGDQLGEYANVKIYESIICYRFYEKYNPGLIKIGRDKIGPGAIGGVDEMWCKADGVAAELASLLSTQMFFDGLPNLLFCLPAGWLADRVGRRPFLILGVVGIALRAAWMQGIQWQWQTFDVRWSWVSAVFLVPCGGSYFTTSILYIVCSDLTAPQDRATTFFRLGAVNISASLLMPPLAAILMDVSPWTTQFLGLSCTFVGILCSLLIPETLRHHPSEPSDPSSSDSASLSVPGWYAQARSSLDFLLRDWRVPALVMTFMVHVPITSGTQLLLQYISKRYDLRLSQATFLITIREAVHVALLFLILPFLQEVFLRIYNDCGPKKDLSLARISVIVGTLGFVMISAAPNVPLLVIGLIIAALGTGASFLTRSFLTFLVPSHHLARIFALIGIVSGFAQMFAAPLLAQLFKRGMALGGWWVALPYIVISAASMLLIALLFCIRLREHEKVATGSGDVDGAEEAQSQRA